jgi:hypothetical protein
MKITFASILFLIFISSLQAGLYLHPRLGYHSSDDSAEGQTYSSTYIGSLFGATFGSSDRFYIGVNVNQWSKAQKGSETLDEGSVSLLEMGPMLGVFIDKQRTVFASLAYNMYASGTRTTSAGTDDEISGSSIFAQLGYLVKFTKSLYLGLSMNYHSVSLSKSVINSTESDISDTYSTIYPSIDISIRFR